MWSAIVSSAVTIAAVLYMQGPIVALVLTAVSSLALLIALHATEKKAASEKPRPRPLEVIDGNNEVDLLFPPLHQQAS
ncbi:MAG TPA: hypothetical protein VGW96_07060 [Candidatus Eremiobacteraceae bacterium]|jgi:hypothetical protein|nr:hypothetical protein [Candidatus Eremiobacteraceae bacterium]